MGFVGCGVGWGGRCGMLGGGLVGGSGWSCWPHALVSHGPRFLGSLRGGWLVGRPGGPSVGGGWAVLVDVSPLFAHFLNASHLALGPT